MTSNKSLILAGTILTKLATLAGAAVVVDDNWTVNTAIPDSGAVGLTAYQTLAGLSSNPITDLTVNLNVSGGFNGALYGYLTLQDANGNTATELLLNQVGTSLSNPVGSPGSGFDVTLSDAGVINGNIHHATGNPTGTWQPDSVNSLDSTFGGLDANGTWTLFLVDRFNGGGTATLNSWGLDIAVADVSVPEPSETGLLFGSGGLTALGLGRLFFRRRSLAMHVA